MLLSLLFFARRGRHSGGRGGVRGGGGKSGPVRFGSGWVGSGARLEKKRRFFFGKWTLSTQSTTAVNVFCLSTKSCHLAWLYILFMNIYTFPC